MFEQRVFRELKKRGYHVVPQYPVGSRRLDLVVAGDGGASRYSASGIASVYQVVDSVPAATALFGPETRGAGGRGR